MSYAHDYHYEWIESAYGVKCSPLGKQVANILGYVGGGIYNAPFNTEKVEWGLLNCIEVTWQRGMANWDFSSLTKLVIECHRRMLRVEIKPCNMQNLKLRFWQRTTRDTKAEVWDCMPDIEYMIQIQDKEWGRA